MDNFGIVKNQQGSSLIEVMIATLVVSIGMLGVAGLQLKTLAANQEQLKHSTVTMLTYTLAESIRADASNAACYDTSAVCGAALASNVLTSWQVEVRASLGDTVVSSISYDASSGAHTITIDGISTKVQL